MTAIDTVSLTQRKGARIRTIRMIVGTLRSYSLGAADPDKVDRGSGSWIPKNDTSSNTSKGKVPIWRIGDWAWDVRQHFSAIKGLWALRARVKSDSVVVPCNSSRRRQSHSEIELGG